MINYTPFGHSDWQTIVADVKPSAPPARRPPWSPPSTATPTCRSTRNSGQGIKAEDIPVVAFSVGEEELAPASTPARSSATWPPGTTSSPPTRRRNAEFIETWQAFIGEERVTNDPMEAHYIGFNMWVKAVEAAGTTDVDAVIDAMYGVWTYRT
jgi:urea transport system substrate-binding protein